MIEQALQSFGLNQKEIKVYLATLELGMARVSEIAKKSGIERTNCYSILEKLMALGLVLEIGVGKRKQFAAEPPEKINLILANRQKEVSKILPELKSIYNLAPKKPKIRFYEGKEGHLTVYGSILTDKPKELLVLIDYQKFLKLIDAKTENDWIAKRIKLGINLRWLDFESEKMRLERQNSSGKLRQIKFLPDEFKTSGGIFIYQDKLIFLSTSKEFMAVVIENEEFAGLAKMVFEMLWGFVGK